MMLLYQYHGIWRSLAKSEQFIKAFAGIFREIQQYPAMLRHNEVY